VQSGPDLGWAVMMTEASRMIISWLKTIIARR
jgi:hypothetical protein